MSEQLSGAPLRNRANNPDSGSLLFPLYGWDFFVFFPPVAYRQGAIFGTRCSGCSSLTHPSRLVFKEWASGWPMMRTLFQSRPPSWRTDSPLWGLREVCPVPVADIHFHCHKLSWLLSVNQYLPKTSPSLFLHLLHRVCVIKYIIMSFRNLCWQKHFEMIFDPRYFTGCHGLTLCPTTKTHHVLLFSNMYLYLDRCSIYTSPTAVYLSVNCSNHSCVLSLEKA